MLKVLYPYIYLISSDRSNTWYTYIKKCKIECDCVYSMLRFTLIVTEEFRYFWNQNWLVDFNLYSDPYGTYML